jgi:hypothetical protein
MTIWTGRKPTKRTFEMLCHYFMGWADDEELFDHIEKLKQASNKKKNSCAFKGGVSHTLSAALPFFRNP